MTIDTTDGVPSAPSALANPSGAAAFAYRLLAETPGHVCASARVEVTSAGSGSPTLFRLRTTANGPVIRVYVNASGALAIRSDAGGTQTSSGVAAGSGWHLVELCGTVGTSSTWDLSRDGATIVNAWVANTGSTPIGRLEIGDVTAKTFTIGFDDVRMDSAPG